MNELELYHYGVKGMKWGVRKNKNASIETTNSQKVRARYEEMKNLRNEYKRAKRTYTVERDKLNEAYSGKQNILEKVGKKYGIPKRVNRYMNSGENITSARVKTYAELGASVVATASVMLLMPKLITELEKYSRN